MDLVSSKVIVNVTSSDDLPLRGFIGHLEEGGFLPHRHKIFLWAHLNFNIEYNGDQVNNHFLNMNKIKGAKIIAIS